MNKVNKVHPRKKKEKGLLKLLLAFIKEISFALKNPKGHQRKHAGLFPQGILGHKVRGRQARTKKQGPWTYPQKMLDILKEMRLRKRRDKIRNLNDDLPSDQQINPGNMNAVELKRLTVVQIKKLQRPDTKRGLSAGPNPSRNTLKMIR